MVTAGGVDPVLVTDDLPKLGKDTQVREGAGTLDASEEDGSVSLEQGPRGGGGA